MIEDFNENFFSRSKEEVMAEYKHIMDNTLGVGLCGEERIAALHDLGYLPLEIKALPEGTRVPVGVEEYRDNTQCRGVVLGISGGKDSTTVAMLVVFYES